MFLWFQIINCISIDWNYTLHSQCAGRIIKILDSDFLSDGYLDVFDECEKHRRCGCIETSDGVYWDLVEGTNTFYYKRKWCPGVTCQYNTWVSKWITFSSRNFKYKHKCMNKYLTYFESFQTYKNFEKEKNCGRRNCPGRWSLRYQMIKWMWQATRC